MVPVATAMTEQANCRGDEGGRPCAPAGKILSIRYTPAGTEFKTLTYTGIGIPAKAFELAMSAVVKKRKPGRSEIKADRSMGVTLKFDLPVTVSILYNSNPHKVCHPWNIVGYLKPSTERTYLLTKRPSTRMMIKIDAAPIFILDPLDSMIKSLLDQNVFAHPFQSRI